MAQDDELSHIGLFGLAVMGQNFALNIGSKGFRISVCNRSPAKVDKTVARAQEEGVTTLRGYKDLGEFAASLQKPRAVIILVKAGAPVEAVIEKLIGVLEPGDLIIDGGNEWYENTERRSAQVAEHNLLYMGMGISGGEEGARNGPSLMPGGPVEAWQRVEEIMHAAAARATDGTVCVTHIGEGGSGNYVKMVHNGIEYGDMQLIAEAYDLLQSVGGLNNEELAQVFERWNEGELKSFLIDITKHIFRKKDDNGNDWIDRVLDKTGNKGTGRWTVQESAMQSVPCPTISAALNARYLSALKDSRMKTSEVFTGPEIRPIEAGPAREGFIESVRQALYASKICSYAQGMNLIKEMGEKMSWNLDLAKIASIWKAGCIIRARFLDRITDAYNHNANLDSLLLDPDFARDIQTSEVAWRKVVTIAIASGIAVPALSGSLAYYDTYRRAKLPANLTQAQRDAFGAHTFRTVEDPSADPIHVPWLPGAYEGGF